MARIGVLSSVALAGQAKLDMDVWVCMLTVKFVLGDLFSSMCVLMCGSPSLDPAKLHQHLFPLPAAISVVSDRQDVGMELATGYGKGAATVFGLLDSCHCACTWTAADSATERLCVFLASHFYS